MAAEKHRPSVIVWGSGSGTTFRAIAEALHNGLVDFDIVAAITDREESGFLDQVAKANWRLGIGQIETVTINRRRFPGGPQNRGQTQAEAEATCEVLRKHGDAVLLLAGCTRILGQPVLDEFGWRPEWADEPDQGKYQACIVNTHPGIVPQTADTYGVVASRRVLEWGLPQTAHTFMVVGGSIDGGPVIAEHRLDVPDYPLTTEAQRETAAQHMFTQLVQPAEKAYLPHDLAAFLARREVMV